MISDRKREEAGWRPEKEDNPQESTGLRVSGNEFRSTGEPARSDIQELLPSYEYEPSSPSNLTSTSTSASLGPSQIPTEFATQTPSSPTPFPASVPPPYTPSRSPHLVRFAIPQTHPNPTAPLLPSYPSTLSAHGITPSTWSTFLQQISSHLSTRTPKRLLAHAGDVATTIPRKLGKDLLSTGTAAGKTLGQSAKNLNPVGVLGSVLGLTFGVTGVLVGSLVGVPGAIATKPRTPLERAGVLLEEANRTWLHERGLHVELLRMEELAGRVGSTSGEILEAARTVREGDAARKMARLRPWVGEMVVGREDGGEGTVRRDGQERGGCDQTRMDTKDQGSFARGAETVGLSVTGSFSVEGRDEGAMAGSSIDRDAGLVLELGPDTMWLVVSRWEGKVAT